MSVYRLELLPTEQGAEFYKDIEFRPNDNAGYDLYVSDHRFVEGEYTTLLPLGCRARLVRLDTEQEVHFWLAPRSSIFKARVFMANSMGIIDRTYRGELMGAVASFDHKTISIHRGVRLFQIVAPDMGWIREVRIVDSLPETSRGDGGFGSTGK